MSLINDALKKAQKQRTGDNTPLAAMPGVGGESAARIAQRDKPAGFNSLLVRLGLGAGAVLVLAVGGYFMMRKPAEKPSAVSVQPSAPVSQPSPVVPTTAPSSTLPAPSSPPVVQAPQATAPSSTLPAPSSQVAAGFTLPVVTPPPPAPEPVVVKKPLPATTSKPATGGPLPAPSSELPASKPPAPAGKLDSKAITYIESLRVAGIRASATDSKVLMNDRVYRVGDIVEHEMNLKIVGITANSMTFEDEHGARYTRQF